MVTTFRFRKQLLAVEWFDLLADPDAVPLALEVRRRLAREHDLPEGLISVCAQPLDEVHAEQVADRVRVPGKRKPARLPAGLMTPEEIRRLKDDLGMTFDEMARRLNVDLRTVQHWMEPVGRTGHRKPRGPALKLLQKLRREADRESRQLSGTVEPGED